MSLLNCSSCDDLRRDAPHFMAAGLTETECTSLKNNTGLSTTNGNNSCTDLDNMNDCLVGNMAAEASSYQTCDWKEFMKQFIPNIWTVFKGIICTICGLWSRVSCTYSSLVKLVNKLAETTAGVAFVRYYRDLGAGDSVPFWENVDDGFERTLDIYMDSAGASSGTKVADRDYVVIVQNCTNYQYFNELNGRVTVYSSGDTRSASTLRSHLAQHPSIDMADSTNSIVNFSWTTSSAVLIKKGEHIKVNFYVSEADKGSTSESGAPKVRLHQFILTWIPVNVEEALDPSEILDC